MPEIVFEPAYRVLLPSVAVQHIILVGVGGTGSHLGAALASLAYEAARRGIELRLTFIDHDLVEERNVGRQLFSATEIGRNKAVTFAWRMNQIYGLKIAAIPQMFCSDTYHQQYPQLAQREAMLIVGAVDNHIARAAIAQCVNTDNRVWWLDCGNAATNGHVLIGNFGRDDVLRKPKMNLGLWKNLPAPHRQDPGILQPDPAPAPRSCAELVQGDEQSLMVNRMVAAIAAQYCADFVLRRELYSMATHFNLVPPLVTSTRVTDATMTPYLGDLII